jgi:hypothetical protein
MRSPLRKRPAVDENRRRYDDVPGNVAAEPVLAIGPLDRVWITLIKLPYTPLQDRYRGPNIDPPE